MEAVQQYKPKSLRAPAEWWRRIAAYADMHHMTESEAVRSLCTKQLDMEALGKVAVPVGPSLDEMRAMVADLLAAHTPTIPLAPAPRCEPAADDMSGDVLDVLRHIYLSAEAALQAVAYQRDHPNLPADEIVAHARTAAARRMLTHEWPEM